MALCLCIPEYFGAPDRLDSRQALRLLAKVNRTLGQASYTDTVSGKERNKNHMPVRVSSQAG
jgi:hypothetical protein